MNYGLQEFKDDVRNYITGQAKMPWIEYNDTGDWENDRTKFEKQFAPTFDTYNCTGFGATDDIENFIKLVYGVEENYSDRWVGIIAGTKAYKGNDPINVYNAIREFGLIPERMLPFNDSIKTAEEYFSFKGANQAECFKEGQKWLERNELRYELLWGAKRPENYVELIIEALKTSPVGLSVDAWRDENNVFVNFLPKNNHWTLGINQKDGEVRVKDTYLDDNSDIKQLAKDHNIQKAIRIWVNRRTKPAMKAHIVLLESILKSLKLMNPTLLDVCTQYLGKDASPENQADSEVACAESVAFLLRQVYPETPKIVSTIVLNTYLRNNTAWKQVNEYEAGCIVVSPTEGTRIGHTGVVMEDNTIASNNSYGTYKGKFTKNYSPVTWEKRYSGVLKLPVNIYKHV